MLDVQKVRLRFISTRLLASAPPICKSAGKAQLLRAAHKLILNVSKIRLRLICARVSYLYRLFAKGLRQKARLRVLFALRLVSGTTIFKSAGYTEAARMPLVPRSNKFARQTCSPKYTRMYILDEDGGGFKQQRCFCIARTRCR